MSRIGKKSIPLPPGVKIQWEDRKLTVSGPKGTLERVMPPRISLEITDGELRVQPEDESRTTLALWGLSRTLAANMVTGVSQGFTRVLELVGTGYKVEGRTDSLVFNIGYSLPVEFALPEGISAKVEKANRIELSGADKELLGQTVAIIRGLRAPDAYKGKGIKRLGEVLRRKMGKTGGR
jgi:large subunit ribosomal protein L6